jgi:hypothetical protein
MLARISLALFLLAPSGAKAAPPETTAQPKPDENLGQLERLLANAIGSVPTASVNTSNDPIGPHYVSPGRVGLCSSEYPEEQNLSPSLGAAVLRDRKTFSGGPLSVPAVSTRVLQFQGGISAYLSAITADAQTVAHVYYNGLLAYCSPDKSTDLRFYANGIHTRLYAPCSVSHERIYAVVRAIQERAHPLWLVVSPCGLMEYAHPEVLSLVGVSSPYPPQ